jgi:glutathione S-transferase
MEVTLQHNRFLTGAQATAADVCLYAYTHVAHEGGFDLTQYPAIQNWLVNVSGLKGFTAMV